MKKLLITLIILLITSFSSKAQNSIICQPDSVKFYFNMAEYPFTEPIDSEGWMKFSYDEDGLLTHFRKEGFSEELWYYEDHTYEYDSYHNLTRDSIKRDSYNAMYGTSWINLYTYQDINLPSTYTEYFFDHHASSDNPWSRQDSISYQYDALGRLSETWAFYSPGHYVISDYEYQDNEVVVTEKKQYNGMGKWAFLDKRIFSYSDNGLLLSCRQETDSDTCLTTYSYNEQGMVCGILKQKLQNGEYVDIKRVVFELNEHGYPSAVDFEKWDEGWVEGDYHNISLPQKGDDCFFVFAEDYLTQQNKQVLMSYVKRLELYYSYTKKPNYALKEQTVSAFATLYPNPTSGLVTITGQDLKSAEVFNTLGQQVATPKGEDETMQIDLSELPIGVYFVNITDEEGRKCVRKVVKE